MTELESFGDVELRICKGRTLPANEEWFLPVFVRYFRNELIEYGRVAPALPLTAEQARYLAQHFSLHNKWKREDVFLVDRKFVDLLTYRAAGITPAYYFKWPGQEAPIDKKTLRIPADDLETQVPDDTENFIGYLHRRCHIDMSVCRMVISAIMREAPSWLMAKKKPVDLGFVKIYAVPYRANWKEILLARFPNAYWWMKYRSKPGFENGLDNENVRAQMAAVEMQAIHGSHHYLHWTLEVVPTEDWEKAVREHEKMKMASGRTEYVKSVERTIESLSSTILEIFTSYLEKVARSFPKLVAGRRPGSKKLVPYRGPTKVLPKIGQNIPCRIVVNLDPKQIGEGDDPKVLVRPAAIKVSKVSPLLQADHDVRGPILEAELVKPENEQIRTGGLPVHHEPQSAPAWEPVLPGPEPDASGVDKRTD